MTYLGAGIPKLGFGLMRLPQLDGKLDIAQAKTVADALMAAGCACFAARGRATVSDCIERGQRETACPQRVNVMSHLSSVAEALD